jgi:hypothetical protein
MALSEPRAARSWSGEVESIFVREALLHEATGGKVRCNTCERRCTIVPQLAALTEVMCQCDETRMNIARHAITAHHRSPHFQN